jgi:Flp pilus assembly pilin Flp
MVEYAMVLGLVALVAIGSVKLLGPITSFLFTAGGLSGAL